MRGCTPLIFWTRTGVRLPSSRRHCGLRPCKPGRPSERVDDSTQPLASAHVTSSSELSPLVPTATTVRIRFALLLGVLLAGFFASFLFIRNLENAEAAELLAHARQQRATLLAHWLRLTEHSLRRLTSDVARHAAVTSFLAKPDASAATRPLAPVLAASDAHALWVAAPDGTSLLAVGRPDDNPPPQRPLGSSELRGLLDGARPPHVFLEHAGGIWELCGEPIAPAALGLPTPGWLLLGRRWGAAHLATLSSLTGADVRLEPAHSPVPAAAELGGVVISHPLTDWQGRILKLVVLRHHSPEMALLLTTDAWQARVFLVFGLLVLVGLGLALHVWVLRPLAAIRESLTRGESGPLAPLQADRTELGALATLVAASFAQRDALRREVELRTRTETELRQSQEELRRTIDERASLGRDLHDGVIQSLYAAGMSLASVRSMLKPEQEDASVRLEQSRAALNETIRDVRNFITGLEPEALRERSFSQAVTALLSFMQSVKMFRAITTIDEATAALLTLGQRVHALQIAREAVSNALRHGEAAEVAVSLAVTDAGIEFEIRDNGRGFIPGATRPTPGSGHGLANFTRRAQEIGAELILRSELGQGTSIRLIFPLYL